MYKCIYGTCIPLQAFGTTVRYGSATPITDALPVLAQRACDSAPSVRSCLIDITGEWLLDLPDRSGSHLVIHMYSVHMYRNLVIFPVENISYVITHVFRAFLILYAPHIVYETRVDISLLKIFVRLIFVRTAAYKIK